jgi:hypothetical protein
VRVGSKTGLVVSQSVEHRILLIIIDRFFRVGNNNLSTKVASKVETAEHRKQYKFSAYPIMIHIK